MKSAAIVALALACAQSIEAQDALAPDSTPRPLPGVADIDFSLDGRATESAGTPTEGPARSAASASPVASDVSPRASPAPDAASTGADGGNATVRRQTDPADGGASAPSAVDPVLTERPLPDASPPSQSGEAGANVSPGSSAAIGDASAMPAWPFGLALLALAVWFALRRLRRRAPQAEHREVTGRETSPSPHDREPDPPLAKPEAASEPVPPLGAHPALQVRVPETIESTVEPPPAPTGAGITRYDAFGRPIAPPPRPMARSAPPSSPPPPPKPRARIIRYDAMGLPILD